MHPGIPTGNGSWTGMMGMIQRNEVDFTIMSTVNEERNTIIDHEKTCEIDHIVILSLKPQLLPQYLVIIRPFTGDVWMYLLVTVIVWALSLWILQKTWARIFGGPGMTFHRAIFYSWAVFLEEPPPKSPTNTTGQMLLGWWLVTCLLMATAYRSSLVANLTVQSKTKPIDTFEDLVNKANWQYGWGHKMANGAPSAYFKLNTNPAIKHIYKYLKATDIIEGLTKVKSGVYSFIGSNNNLISVIASFYTDDFGQTPYYISKRKYKVVSDIGWSFRKGAPFRHRFAQLINRMLESGITDHWVQDVMKSRIRQNRAQQRETSGQTLLVKKIESDGQIVLRMIHLMGVFILLCLGFGISILTFLAERMMWTPNDAAYDEMIPGSHLHSSGGNSL